MKYPDLFEVPRCLNTLRELLPKALKHIDLQILVQVVYQEAHVLPQLHGQPENGHLIKMLHLANLLRPYVLQLQLDPLYRQQETEESVVLFMDVRTEHQVDGPVTLVDKGETAPGILLIGLDTRLKDPVLDEKHVG